jgi:uncharacterized protein
MPRALDAAALRQTMRLYADALRTHREELDSLNVYPVPDGDTGINLLLTQEAVIAALDAVPEGGGETEVGAAVSRASLMGARGNSGVILSQVLRGLFEFLPADGVDDGPAVARAIGRASDEAWRAVAKPVEGTVLSVLRDAAEAANAPGADGRPPSVLEEIAVARNAAKRSLGRTRQTLPELREAGVVDAGAKGIVLLFDAFHAALTGEAISEPVGPLGPVGSAHAVGPPPEALPAFEVQYLLEAADAAIPPLREALGGLGDSLVVVGGGGLFNVHVHTDEPGRAVELGIDAGRPRDISIVSLAEQVSACIAGQARAMRVAEQACALVAVADGDGLIRTFASLGALVVRGGLGTPPSVSELLQAIEAAPAPEVAVLPNHPSVTPAAERVGTESSKRVVVVPTRSIPAGLAAAAAFNPLTVLDENVGAVSEAALSCRAGEMVRAEPGRWLATIEGEPVHAGDRPEEVVIHLARRLAQEGSEVITVVVGAEASSEDRGAIEGALCRSFPGLSVEVVEGGQPHATYLIGVE